MGGPEADKDDLKGRDLLVGRPEGAERRAAAGAAPPPPAATSLQPGSHDDAIREILETVRATAARIDAFQESIGPGREPAEALARETAALTQAVEDARGTLAEAAELAARREGQESAESRTLAKAVASLKTQGAVLDKRLRGTGKQAEAVAEGIEDLKQTAAALDGSLRTHAENMSRIADSPRWRRWRFGLAIAAASFVFFVLGAVLQREAGVVSFGDPRDAWNDYVAERYAPTLAACTSRARHHDRTIRCQLRVGPARELTVPLHDGVSLEEVPPEEDFDGTAEP